jgi:hypothetical protein
MSAGYDESRPPASYANDLSECRMMNAECRIKKEMPLFILHSAFIILHFFYAASPVVAAACCGL